MARRRRCAFCDDLLPREAHPSRKYCDDRCRRHQPKEQAVQLGPVAAAIEEAIEAAQAENRLTKNDAGAIAALRFLAKKIDTEDQMRDLALAYAEEHRQKPPPVDNVSVPTFLKYCDALGLTPAGRSRIGDRKAEAPGGGKLSSLQDAARRHQRSA